MHFQLQDLCRTMPINACFQTKDSIGTQKLKRVLMSIAWLYRDIGYCQGIGMVIERYIYHCRNLILINLCNIFLIESRSTGFVVAGNIVQQICLSLSIVIFSNLNKHPKLGVWHRFVFLVEGTIGTSI